MTDAGEVLDFDVVVVVYGMTAKSIALHCAAIPVRPCRRDLCVALHESLAGTVSPFRAKSGVVRCWGWIDCAEAVARLKPSP